MGPDKYRNDEWERDERGDERDERDNGDDEAPAPEPMDEIDLYYLDLGGEG